MSDYTLRIENMHCGSCIRRVSQALAAISNIEVKEVRVGAARFTEAQDAGPADQVIAQAVAALSKAGYPAHLES